MAYVNTNIIERPLGTIELLVDGERASASVFNRPLIDLRDNQNLQQSTINEIAGVLANTNIDFDTLSEVSDQLVAFNDAFGAGGTATFLGGVDVGGDLNVQGSISGWNGKQIATEEFVLLNSSTTGNVSLTDETHLYGNGVTTTFGVSFNGSSIGVYVEGIKIDPYFIKLHWEEVAPPYETGTMVEFINGYIPADGDAISLVSYGGADVYNKTQTDIRIAQEIDLIADNYDNITANTVALTLDYLFCDTTASAFTVTLPDTPAIGDKVTIQDAAGMFATNNLTVSRSTGTIRGAASDLVLNTNWIKIELIYTGTTWIY